MGKPTAADMERALRAYDEVRFRFNPDIRAEERHRLAIQAALDALEPPASGALVAQRFVLAGLIVLMAVVLTRSLWHLMF